MRRRLAFGVWEGPQGDGFRSSATSRGLWGGRLGGIDGLGSDAEIADAELFAIHEILRARVRQSADPAGERVLILSDSLGCLDALEAAWRRGDARGLRTHERGAMLESCCVLRAQLGRVVFMYLQAHAGNSLSGMADACAKAHLAAPPRRGDAETCRIGHVRSDTRTCRSTL